MLFDKYKIEIPIMIQEDKKYIRVSYQVFNEIGDIDYLISALKEIAFKKELLII